MRPNHKQIATAVLAITAIVATLLGWKALSHRPYGNTEPAVLSQQADPSVPFKLMEASNLSLDGAPALALTFSQPLDAKQDLDGQLQVFEMPQPVSTVAKPAEDNPDEEDGDTHAKEAPKQVVSTAAADVDTKGGTPVSGAWVVGDNPRLLYFPHIKPQARYVIVVKPGLVDTLGRKLGQDTRYSVLTAEVAPAYYFASNGMVLPAGQNGGLPVVTVNVPEVDVQFLRVRQEQLPRFMEMVIAGKKKPKDAKKQDDEEDIPDWRLPYDQRHHTLHGAVSGWELDPLHAMADSVYQGRFITEPKRNKQSVTFLPVEDVKELKQPGIYVAVMSKPGRFGYDYQTTYFYVSDLGLSLHLYPGSATTLVSSLTDGKAMSGVTVSWLDSAGKVLQHAETGGDGRADFARWPEQAKLVMAEKDGQISMLALKEPALDLSEYSIGGEPYKPVRLFAYSGRDLYRPGEGFDVSIVARDADGHPVLPQPIQATLKRPDGHNQLVSTLLPNPQWPGYYRQHIEVPVDAPTGGWTLELRNDPADKTPGTTFRFNAEEFLPERMKLDLASPQAALSDKDDSFTVNVNGNYLFGAPAAGNRLLGVVEYARNLNPLSGQLPGYIFGNVADDSVAKRQELEEQQLDGQGKASVDVDTKPAQHRDSPVAIRATLSLLETGGRPVVRNLERTLWPAPSLIGIRPRFDGGYTSEDTLAEFDLIRADQSGKLLAAKGAQVRLIRENRNWFWRYDDQRGWNSGFTDTTELVATTSVDIPAGRPATVKLPVKYGSYRLEVSVPGGPPLASYRFRAGWDANEDQSNGVRPDRVALKLDKAAYHDGDTAHLTIAAPHHGEAIVAVEADRVLWLKRVSITSDSQELDIPLDPGWKRQDMYVSVTVLRPGNEGDQVTPTRALGLAHIGIDRSDRELAVSVSAPDKIKPETRIKVQVKAPGAAGQKALVTLSAVDEGILNITNYKTPDPLGFFFGQLRYGADLHDIYGRLIEKMAGTKGKLKWGGDGTPKASHGNPKKLRLIDLFSGPVALDAQGNATIPLNVPDFNGRLRLMAVVSSADHFGAAERSMTVAAPLIAELNTPRFIGLGDTASLALDLHNLSGAAQTLKVNVSASGGLSLNGGVQSVALQNLEKSTLRFTVNANGAPGLADLRVEVLGQGIKIDRHFALQIEAPTPLQQAVSMLVVEPGQSVMLKNPAPADWYPGHSTQVMLSALPPLDIRRVVQGLLVYPYGCAEQTTSTSYPYVFIDEAAARRYGLKPYSREERATILERSIARLGAMQAPNGGFSLWGDAAQYDYWLSAYVTQFLQDARGQGFTVPDAMYTKAIGYLIKDMAAGIASLPARKAPAPSNWDGYQRLHNRNFEALAYGALVLAHDRKVSLASLRQLYDLRLNAGSGLALVELGIALQQMGDPQRAKTALNEGISKPRSESTWYDYGSNVRDLALSYALIQRNRVELPNSAGLLLRLSDALRQQPWLSTQDQLAVFLAARGLEAGSQPNWSVQLDDGKASKALNGSASLYQTLGVNYNGAAHLQNTGKGKLFVQLSSNGYPHQVPQGKDDLSVTHRYFNAKGEPLAEQPELKVGDLIWVEVSSNANRFLPNALVVDRIPAGLEIENTHLVQGERGDTLKLDGADPNEAMSDDRITHVEFRDDRFAAAVRMGGWWKDPLKLYYRARVVTPGRFVLPPAYVEDMYNPAEHASGKGGGMLTVVDAHAPVKKPVKSENDKINPNPTVAQP